MSTEMNVVIEVALVRQSIRGQQYLILENRQQLRTVIHRLVLVRVAETDVDGEVLREFSGASDDILLIDSETPCHFMLDLDPVFDQGYLPLGLMPDRYIPGVTVKSLEVELSGTGVDIKHKTSVPQNRADRALVQRWLNNRSDWLQTHGPVIYV